MTTTVFSPLPPAKTAEAESHIAHRIATLGEVKIFGSRIFKEP